ncbi:putative phosphatase phospho1 [Podila verticillata]|nr:putative phosphatase phospho1 [Podila verticillata]
MSTSTFAKRLFVFDFDWTLIECDSDNWVFQHLNKNLYQVQLESAGKVQWTDLQQRLLGELFAAGVSRKDIEDTLSRVPFDADMIEALTLMKTHGSELYILSDANTVYIETVLKAHKIDHLFTRILTNPAKFDDQGRLNVVRFHGLDKAPHGCHLPCEPNICKGQELQKLIDSQCWDQVIYMGDSTNDFCPSTRLQSSDVVLARKGLLLESLITKSPELIRGEVVYWENAQDVLTATKVILEIDSIPSISSSSSTTLLSTIVAPNTMIPSSKSTASLSAVESEDSRLFTRTVKA